MVRLSELRERDIVEVAGGRRLGMLGDLEIDAATGQIVALVVPGATRLFGLLGAQGDCRIPWAEIVTIGSDVILVRHAAAPGEGRA